ncbi:MAG: YgiT-type zinc finger protein [Acidobacteria bacterium]|nr:YgiT-type zinc finger protein [Acidobacteriota bacterium]MBI3427102.1 YgiT-type zinc finger protein [Acidobacteriota bacterium]
MSAKNINKSVKQLCESCGHTAAQVVKRPQVIGKGAAMLVIEDVPVIVCRHCGESYLTAETLHRLDEVRRGQRKLPARYQIAVAAFA